MNKGIIYIIKCKDKNIKDCYIGSTTNLKKRIINHKSDCNNENTKNYNAKKYQFIRENGGFDNFYFEILENDIEFNNRKELNKIERYYVEEFKSNLNTELPCRTKKELKELKQKLRKKYKDYDKQYRIDNKEKMTEYYNINKEKIKEKNKEHYNINKKIINEKKKIKITCECGSELRKADISRHCKSIKHLDFINNKLSK